MARPNKSKGTAANNNSDKEEVPSKVEESPMKGNNANNNTKEHPQGTNHVAHSPLAKGNRNNNQEEEKTDLKVKNPFKKKEDIEENDNKTEDGESDDKKSNHDEFFAGDIEVKATAEKKQKKREQNYQPMRFLYFKGNEILKRAGISGIIIVYGYNKDPPIQARTNTNVQPAFIHYHVKEMETNKKFMKKTMGVIQVFKMRRPDGSKGYWYEKTSGYHRPFHAFAILPNKGDEEDGRATCEAFIEKLNDTKNPEVQHVISQYTSAPKFKLFSHAVKPMGGEVTISKVMAADDIIHTWRNLGMDPDLILSDEGLSKPLGKDLLKLFYGTTDESLVKNIRKVNELIKKQEKAGTEFFFRLKY